MSDAAINTSATDLIQLGLAIAEGVTQAIPEALAAFDLVQQMTAEKRDPTAAEWATLDAAADALHAAVQDDAASPPAGPPDPAPAASAALPAQ